MDGSINIADEIEKRLFVSTLLSAEKANNFYNTIAKYLSNRSRVITFLENLDKTIQFYELMGFTYEKMLFSIERWPSIIHAQKEDLLYKYLLLGKLVNSNGLPGRDDIVLNSPKDLMTGLDTLYARTMYFLSDISKGVVRTENITRRKLLKITNEEFMKSYFVSKEELLKMFPFDYSCMAEVMSWPENKEIVDKMNPEKSVNFHG